MGGQATKETKRNEIKNELKRTNERQETNTLTEMEQKLYVNMEHLHDSADVDFRVPIYCIQAHIKLCFEWLTFIVIYNLSIRKPDIFFLAVSSHSVVDCGFLLVFISICTYRNGL